MCFLNKCKLQDLFIATRLYTNKIETPWERTTWSDFFSFPELEKAYPGLKGIELDITILPKDTRGYSAKWSPPYKETPGKITIRATLANLRKAALHEAQHYIQRQEMFGRGSSVPAILARQDDPKVKQKQLEALWNWGMYLIKGRQIKLIEIDPNLSTEQKEKRIKRYQKAKYPFPKDITSFIGAKKIIEEEKKKKKPKTKKLSSLSKPESVKTEKKEEKPAFQDGVLDLKVLFNRFFGE